MAIPNGVTRIVLSGAMPGGEIWSSGFWLDGNPPVDDDAADILAGIIAGFLTASTFDAAFAGANSSDTTLTEVSVYGYPLGGPNATSVGRAAVTGVAGTATVGLMPDQVCTVLTLLTGNASRRGRGRMYLPATCLNLSSSHQIPSAIMAAWTAGAKDFFDRINADGAIGDVAVVSIAGSATRVVTDVRMDSRVDIQRRRADQQAPERQSVAVLA